MINSLSKAFAVACLPFVAGCTPPTIAQKSGAPFRRLTGNEVSFAQTIFGHEINYGSVKLYKQTGHRARGGINNGIYMPIEDYQDDYALQGDVFEKSTFIHELTHIWQKQNGTDIVGSAIDLFFKNGGDYDRSYDYTPAEISNFGNLGIEQQASIVEDYFQMKYNLQQNNNRNLCVGIRRYETALRPSFPDIKTPRPCR